MALKIKQGLRLLTLGLVTVFIGSVISAFSNPSVYGTPGSTWACGVVVCKYIGHLDLFTGCFRDLDCDGISNALESKKGIDINKDGKLDLLLPGAKYTHKDIFVEVDYMKEHNPNDDAINRVISSFANAPVSNPDGVNGVSLHVIQDEAIPEEASTDLVGLSKIKKTWFGTALERADPISAKIIDLKSTIYHYALFAHQQPGGATPQAGQMAYRLWNSWLR